MKDITGWIIPIGLLVIVTSIFMYAAFNPASSDQVTIDVEGETWDLTLPNPIPIGYQIPWSSLKPLRENSQ